MHSSFTHTSVCVCVWDMKTIKKVETCKYSKF